VQEAQAVYVADTRDSFPDHRIYCVGLNYVNHVREMKENPEREVPFPFSNPSGQVCPGSTQLPNPMGIANLLHEVELIVAVGKMVQTFQHQSHYWIISFLMQLDWIWHVMTSRREQRKRQDLVLQPKVLTDLLLVLICIRWRMLVT